MSPFIQADDDEREGIPTAEPVAGVDAEAWILSAELRPRQERLLEAILSELRSLRATSSPAQYEVCAGEYPEVGGHAAELEAHEAPATSHRPCDLPLDCFLEGVRQVAEQFAAVVKADGHDSSSPAGGAPAATGVSEPMGEVPGEGASPSVSSSNGTRGGDETSSPRVHVRWRSQLGPMAIDFDGDVLIAAVEEQWRRDLAARRSQ